MTLTTSVPWLRQAQAEKFAVGAFNANTMEQVQAIIMAAEEERAPVIIQISHRAVEYIGAGNRLVGLRYIAEVGRIAAESAKAPVVLHFDHGSAGDVLQALALGFTSVMFDGGDLPYKENVAQTKDLCAAAHEMGACFEAELGDVPRADVPGMETGVLTDPAQAADFVERTGVDALAISLGSIHALKQKEVSLDFDRLDCIHAAVSVPLVLHGSSGVLDESIREGIRRGLSKINVATQLNGAFTRAVRRYLAEHPDDVDPRKYLAPARLSMKEQVKERMRFFDVSGKAADSLQ